MRFSNLVDYKGVPHHVVKTGRKNIRILKPGEDYEKSFVVPLKKVSNRRPAEYVEDDVDDDDDLELEGQPELIEPNEIVDDEDAELEDSEFQPQ
jgi:hypothetical protein